MRKLILLALLFSPMLARAQGSAVPVDQEAAHKVVLKNEYVEVMHVTIAPGQNTMLHAHSHDRVAVNLSESTVNEDVPGKKPPKTMVTSAGSVSVHACAKQDCTHRVHNRGKTTFEALDIELLKRPAGPAASPVTTPAAESRSFRVYRWALAPGDSTQEHTHSRPYLIIAATPMRLLMKSPDGRSMEHLAKAGDFHWIDSKVTHILTNNGKESGVIIEVELQ